MTASNTSTHSFQWQDLGKPDYASTASIIASLPSDIRTGLSKVAEEILRRLLYLMWQAAYRSGRGKGYAWPSEAWLGQCTDRCTRSVRRALRSLEAKGLLTTTHRRPIGDCYQTNLYEAGKRLIAVLFARGYSKKRAKSAADKYGRLEPKVGTKSPGNGGSLVKGGATVLESSLDSSSGSTADDEPVTQVPEEVAKKGGLLGFVKDLLASGKCKDTRTEAQKQDDARKYWETVQPLKDWVIS